MISTRPQFSTAPRKSGRITVADINNPLFTQSKVIFSVKKAIFAPPGRNVRKNLK
jgi:hypothetical protein